MRSTLAILFCLFISFAAAVLVPNPEHCSSYGDPHIHPFPGGHSDVYSPGIQQPGDYLLAEFGTTRVSAGHRSIPSAPPIYINYKVAVEDSSGSVVEITFDDVLVNGVPTVVSSLRLSGITIERTSYTTYLITVPSGTVITSGVSGNYMNIDVAIEDGVTHPIGGLCCPHDGHHPHGGGQYVWQDFATSWQLDYSETPFHYDTQADYDAANPVDYPTSDHYSTDDPILAHKANEKCEAIQHSALAQQCNSIVDSADFFQACVNDVVASGDVGYAASIVDNYAALCALNAHSPITLPTSARNTDASGPGLATSTHFASSLSFTITAKDALGRPRTTGGDTFTVTVTPGVDVVIVDLGNGKYQVTWYPTRPGTYTISVQVNGVDIAGSPFVVTVV